MNVSALGIRACNERTVLSALLHHISAALGAFHADRKVTADKITFRIPLAAIEDLVLLVMTLDQRCSALWTGHIDLFNDRHRITAGWEIRASQKPSEPSVLIHHLRAAPVADNVTDFVRYLDLVDFFIGDFA